LPPALLGEDCRRSVNLLHKIALKKYFCGQCLYFSFSTHRQCILRQNCYVSLKYLYPGAIRTRDFFFLRRMRCPLCHAALCLYDFWCH
jgi:hypothetical protein